MTPLNDALRFLDSHPAHDHASGGLCHVCRAIDNLRFAWSGLLDVAAKTDAFFEDTDSPLGNSASAVLTFARGRTS